MRRLAWLFVVLPLACCQYQQQQRYQQPQYPNQQQQQQQFNGQFNGQQTQQNQQYGQNQQFANQQFQQRNQQQQGYQQQNLQNGQYQGQFNQNNQMGMNGMSPNQITSGRSEVVNTPTRLMSSGNLDNTTPGAQVDIRLNSYSNQDLSLSNTTTCSCPNGKYCDFLAANQQNACQFSFTTVISAKDQSVQFVQSDFYPFSGAISSGNWTNQMSFPFSTKPVAIDIFVQHLGVVIHKVTGSLMFFNHLTLVDSFVVDMSNYIPNQNQNPRTYTLTGTQLKTQLNLVLSVQCINGMMGNDCDLKCDSTVQSSTDNVICTDSQGRNSSCRWNTYKTTVSDCIVCNIVGANGTCASVYMEKSSGVSSAYRTWTIVLGCLLGLAVLLILCLVISFIILRNRTDNDETPSAYKPEPYTNGKSASRPLLDDEWANAPRRPIMPERTDDRGYTRDATSSVSRQEHQV